MNTLILWNKCDHKIHHFKPRTWHILINVHMKTLPHPEYRTLRHPPGFSALLLSQLSLNKPCSAGSWPAFRQSRVDLPSLASRKRIPTMSSFMSSFCSSALCFQIHETRWDIRSWLLSTDKQCSIIWINHICLSIYSLTGIFVASSVWQLYIIIVV